MGMPVVGKTKAGEREEEAMNRKALAIGVLIGIAIVGCIAATTIETQGQRFQLISVGSFGSLGASNSAHFAILDTQTGTVNIHDSDLSKPTINPTVVYPFLAQPQP